MPIVSKKRQITLPAKVCKELGIKPGDKFEVFSHNDQLHIIKREVGAAAGILKGFKKNEDISDNDSLMSNFK